MKRNEHFDPIERQIREARLTHSAALGADIGAAVAAIWHGAAVLASRIAALKDAAVAAHRPLSQH